MCPYMCISMQGDYKTAIISFYIDSELRKSCSIEKTPIPKYEVKLTSDGVLIYMIGTNLKDIVCLKLRKINICEYPVGIAVDDPYIIPNKVPRILETLIKDIHMSFIDFDIHTTPNWLLSLFYEMEDYLNESDDAISRNRIYRSIDSGYMPVIVKVE